MPQRDQCRRQLHSRRAASADCRHAAHHFGVPGWNGRTIGETSGAFVDLFRCCGQHPRHRHGCGRAFGAIVDAASPRARRASACRRAARASADAAQQFDQRRVRPTMMPACGPPSSLSPLKQTRSTPAATDCLHRRLAGRTPVDETAAAEILDERNGASRAAAHQLRQRRPFGEALDAEVRRVHAQQQRRARSDRRAIVRDAGAVGGARLRAARRRTAPSRPARGSRRRSRPARRARSTTSRPAASAAEDQHHGGGVVVDHDRRFRAGQSCQQRLGVHVREPRWPSARSYSRLQ